MVVFPLVAIVVVYAAGLVAAARLVRRAHAAPPLSDEALPPMSVLVAARDEERDLPACLEALGRQDYPSDRVEFLIADDGSRDDTCAIAEAFARRDPRFRCIPVPERAPGETLRGKARALHAAYGIARGALLATTDADCAPPPGWLRHLASQFREPEVDLVCGVTLVEGDRLLDRVQAMDWLLLLAAAAASAELGRPITAMGNNMAMRRSAYEAVGGFPALPFSVTEDYALVRAVDARPGRRVRLIPHPALVNHTRPLDRLGRVFAQRRRWARGGLRAPAWIHAVYAVVWLCHAGLIAGLLAAPLAAFPLLAVKIGADAHLLRTARRKLDAGGSLRALGAFEAYYFAYVAAMPLALLLRPRIAWKGRRL